MASGSYDKASTWQELGNANLSVNNIGMLPSGKAQDFDFCIRRFESYHPSHILKKKRRKIMFWLITFSVLAFGISIYCGIDEGFWGGVITFLLTELVAMFAALIFCIIIGAFISTESNTAYGDPETTELVALQDTYGPSGEFFLGTGSISSKASYVYAVETETGIAIKTLDASRVFLKFDEDSNPRIEYHKGELKSKVSGFFGFNLTSSYYVIYIPDGSFMANYNIDLN